MNNQIITKINTHRYLGLICSNDRTWHEHLPQTKAKAWQRTSIMLKLKFVLVRKSLQTIYFSFIRPLLEYADVVWDNCTQYKTNELKKIQIKAARTVTGAARLVPVDLLYTDGASWLLEETSTQLLHCTKCSTVYLLTIYSRFRCNCSARNQHLFSKDIIQSALCACGHIEDMERFLLYCPTYLNQRQDMLRSVSQLCQPSLIYGNGNLTI